jgi:hypothetical protein
MCHGNSKETVMQKIIRKREGCRKTNVELATVLAEFLNTYGSLLLSFRVVMMKCK